MRENEGIAAHVLARLGEANADDVRKHVINALNRRRVSA
jgi:hypothetical protein